MKMDLESIKKDMQALQKFDWRSLQRFLEPSASQDLNDFLEKLPKRTDATLLYIAGIAWAAAGALGLYATMQLQTLTELRAEFQEAEALQPIVPKVQDVAISSADVKKFVERTADTYTGLDIKAAGSTIDITGNSTALFGQFREAIGHVQNGGSGWRVSIKKLCVGRECEGPPLSASLQINKISVEKPS